MNSNEMALRRRSSADPKQEKSLTKVPVHLKTKPWYKQINWINFFVVVGIPMISLYGMLTTQIQLNTMIFAIIYYFVTGLGITAGYHRLWSHLAYKANKYLEFILMCMASGAFEGSCKYWVLTHRAHHRWTDTDRDPYNSTRGFWYAHFGWLIFHLERIDKVIPMKDIKSNPILKWQHNNYYWFGPFMSFLLPAIISYYFWNDFYGGLFIVGFTRCCFVHHTTWCVNSIAHSHILGGKQNFDDTITPHDSIITALLTLGEGYHNFHHEFPSDFRNGIKWYHYDPTKWLIKLFSLIGLAWDLNQFNKNEIKRGILDMKQKRLLKEKEKVNYGVDIDQLPVWTQKEFDEKVNKDMCVYVIFNQIVHKIPNEFIMSHPGGINMIKSRNGKDITKAFDGMIYNHSNAARNILSHYRVAIINEIPIEH